MRNGPKEEFLESDGCAVVIRGCWRERVCFDERVKINHLVDVEVKVGRLLGITEVGQGDRPLVGVCVLRIRRNLWKSSQQ